MLVCAICFLEVIYILIRRELIIMYLLAAPYSGLEMKNDDCNWQESFYIAFYLHVPDWCGREMVDAAEVHQYL